MLGTFPKDFSQVANSQGYFPKWYLKKCAIYQVATFLRLGYAMGAERCGYYGLGGRAPRLKQAGGLALRLGQTREVNAWEPTQLGSYHLGKYPWEVATGEKSFGKVPNI